MLFTYSVIFSLTAADLLALAHREYLVFLALILLRGFYVPVILVDFPSFQRYEVWEHSPSPEGCQAPMARTLFK